MTKCSNKIENKTHGTARPKNLRMLLLSAVILVAGIVIGSAGTTLLIRNNSHRPPRPGAASAKRITDKLKDRLELSDEQFAKIEPIIKAHMDKLREIQQQARPQIEGEVNQMKEEISTLLTDDQKQKWEKHMKYLERIFRKQRGPGRGHGSGEGRGGRGARGDQEGNLCWDLIF